jgi:hypothetical protein
MRSRDFALRQVHDHGVGVKLARLGEAFRGFDRLMHHVHILEMNGESYRLAESRNHLAVGPQAG